MTPDSCEQELWRGAFNLKKDPQLTLSIKVACVSLNFPATPGRKWSRRWVTPLISWASFFPWRAVTSPLAVVLFGCKNQWLTQAGKKLIGKLEGRPYWVEEKAGAVTQKKAALGVQVLKLNSFVGPCSWNGFHSRFVMWETESDWPDLDYTLFSK